MAEVQYQKHKADPAFRAATAKLGDVELDAVSEAAVDAASSLKVRHSRSSWEGGHALQLGPTTPLFFSHSLN